MTNIRGNTGFIRVIGQELTPFNIRTLTVHLGAFDTNFVNSGVKSAVPLPDDYRGSVLEQNLGGLTPGAFKPDGDHRKAAQAIYDVVVGEGVGEGKEAETAMPLGRDMAALMRKIMDDHEHRMEVFGDICNNVYLGK